MIFRIIIFTLLSFQVLADDWYYGTELNGQKEEFYGSEDMHRRFMTAPPRSDEYWNRQRVFWETRFKELSETLSKTEKGPAYNTLQDDLNKIRNNAARIYMLLGDSEASLKLLLNIENEFSGESTVAENIATCYEHMGDYDNALKWITKAIERNSMAAYSNLWVYEKILRARVGLQKDQDYLKTHTVSGLELEKTKELKYIDNKSMENLHKRYRLAGASKHISEQLQQRLQLLHLYSKDGKDPVLAALIEEAATIYAINEVCEVAVPVFQLSAERGNQDPALIQSRVTQLNELISKNPDSMRYSRSLAEKFSKSTWTIIFAVAFLILLLAIAWYNSARDGKKV